MKWNPIETAPKDGTRFLAAYHDGEIEIVHFDGRKKAEFCWSNDEGTGWGSEGLRHWMPLPELPE